MIIQNRGKLKKNEQHGSSEEPFPHAINLKYKKVINDYSLIQISFVFALIGFQIITTNFFILSVSDIWVELKSIEMYSRLNYVVFLPSILIAFIAPKIMSKISIPKIFVCNVILQIICSIVIGSLPFYKDHISVTYLLFVFHALSFAGTCIAQIAIFSFAAKFSAKVVQFYCIGFSVGALVLGSFIWLFTNLELEPKFQSICYFGLSCAVHITTLIFFVKYFRRLSGY
ncbi:hypothetical protein MHBO_001716 [Bonamia ostreae]|uniref:Uncharacterized protein n=1 Tax=Bonamia ostreae TaxID=126728 RepID=A0ABV2AJY0_9EUKA